MKNVETKIKGIEIIIAGKSVMVSQEQAEELYQCLASLLGKTTGYVTWYPYRYDWGTFYQAKSEQPLNNTITIN